MSVAFLQGGGGSIGTNFAAHLLKRTGLSIVVSSRDPSATKEAILGLVEKDDDLAKRLNVLKMDVTKEDTIEAAAKAVRDEYGPASLRMLLNVSGVLYADKSITQVKADQLLQSFQLNTFGHILTYKHFMSLLPTGADLRKAKERGDKDLANGATAEGLSVLASLTARVGSIGDNKKGGWVGYRSAKAATNQVIRTLQNELALKSTPSIAVALHPGTVVGTNLSKDWTNEADVGKKKGVLTAEDSTGRLLDIIKGLGKDDGGKFYDWEKAEIQW